MSRIFAPASTESLLRREFLLREPEAVRAVQLRAENWQLTTGFWSPCCYGSEAKAVSHRDTEKSLFCFALLCVSVVKKEYPAHSP